MSQKDFQFYLKSQSELLKKYNGKVLVISNENVVESFDNIKEAYQYGLKNCEIGNFIIQLCSPGNSSYSQSFYSRVHFN